MVKRKQADDDDTSAEPFAKGLKTDGGRLGLSAAAASGGNSNGNPQQLSHSATATKGVSKVMCYISIINSHILSPCLNLLFNVFNLLACSTSKTILHSNGKT